MTVTIELPPDIEAGLLAQAKAEGLPLPVYVQRLLQIQFPQTQFPAGATALMTPAERAAARRESVVGLPHTPPLSDQAISRESIYADPGYMKADEGSHRKGRRAEAAVSRYDQNRETQKCLRRRENPLMK
jgi:hypothetical protein